MTTHTIITNGSRYEIQANINGDKERYRCHSIWTHLRDAFGDCDAPIWSTRFLWLARHRLKTLRSRETARVAEASAIWESVREEKV